MKIYLVGGAVRDSLLGLKIKDKDWVVVGCSYKKMLNMGFIPVGNDFPVFLHPLTKEEYSLARTERKKGKGYKGFFCNFSEKISLKEDLYRRDLTINAIAIDSKGIYYDPFNGIKDIRRRIIRHISYSFFEDPLRILRVARFFSFLFRLNFTIHNSTLFIMKKISNTDELFFLKPERIWKETEKSLISDNPELYFFILNKCNALNILFPEMKNIFFNKNIYKFFVIVFNKAVYMNVNIEIRFICMCFFFYETILSNNYFICKDFYLKKIKNFCFRLNIPKRFFLLFKCIYTVIYNITLYKKKNIYINKLLLDILYLIDAWRKKEIVYKLLLIIKIIKILPINNKKIFYLLDKYLLNIFFISYKIKFNFKYGKTYIEIKKNIYNIRLNNINYFLLKKNFIL